MQFSIVACSRCEATQWVADILAIDRAKWGSEWDATNVLMDLPAKWKLSRVAFGDDGKLAGFGFASARADVAHVHRLAVAMQCRKQGLGTRILHAIAMEAGKLCLKAITLKVHRSNMEARRLYCSLGFKRCRTDGENELLEVSLNYLIEASPISQQK